MGGSIFGLIGRKLGHSYSGPIHHQLGNKDYRLIELEPEQIPFFFKDPRLRGLNITIPYKRTVMAYCDVLSPMAQATGSVNTIVRRKDGKLYGFNTDVLGFQYLIQSFGLSFQKKKILVFGKGGASAAVEAAAGNLGASQIVLISRKGPDNYQNLFRHQDAHFLINGTPLGMYPDNEGCIAEVKDFPHCEGVIDLVYNPIRTLFMQKAAALDLPAVGGLLMLVAQAKLAEELFFAKTIPPAKIDQIAGEIRHSMENIVLIGMPGSGKSTLGKILAQKTGRQVFDIDELLVKKEGRLITDIFRKEGETYFRRLEKEQIATVGKQSGSIIVTGGGIVKEEENYRPLHQNGRLYHIHRDTAFLDRRDRPLSQEADLEKMYQKRLHLYTRFRDVIIENNTSPEKAAEDIWREFSEHTLKPKGGSGNEVFGNQRT